MWFGPTTRGYTVDSTTQLVNGQPFTVSGSNFSTKSSSTPRLWDHGQDGAGVVSSQWSGFNPTAGSDPGAYMKNRAAGVQYSGSTINGPHPYTTVFLSGTHLDTTNNYNEVSSWVKYTAPSLPYYSYWQWYTRRDLDSVWAFGNGIGGDHGLDDYNTKNLTVDNSTAPEAGNGWYFGPDTVRDVYFIEQNFSGGSGYVDGTYTNVPMTGGSGTGMLAKVVVSGGAVVACINTNRVTGYVAPTDALTTSNANLGGSGSGFLTHVQSPPTYLTGGGITLVNYGGLTNPVDPDQNGHSHFWRTAGPVFAAWKKCELIVKWATDTTGYIKYIEANGNGSWQSGYAVDYLGPTSNNVVSPLEAIGSTYNRDRGAGNGVYQADCYFDYQTSGLGRFILANNATYTAATIIEVQPYTAWSPTSVTLVCNKGNLPSGTVHLHFRDEVNGHQYLGTRTMN